MTDTVVAEFAKYGLAGMLMLVFVAFGWWRERSTIPNLMATFTVALKQQQDADAATRREQQQADAVARKGMQDTFLAALDRQEGRFTAEMDRKRAEYLAREQQRDAEYSAREDRRDAILGANTVALNSLTKEMASLAHGQREMRSDFDRHLDACDHPNTPPPPGGRRPQ